VPISMNIVLYSLVKNVKINVKLETRKVSVVIPVFDLSLESQGNTFKLIWSGINLVWLTDKSIQQRISNAVESSKTNKVEIYRAYMEIKSTDRQKQ
jgi:hypothetical protein